MSDGLGLGSGTSGTYGKDHLLLRESNNKSELGRTGKAVVGLRAVVELFVVAVQVVRMLTAGTVVGILGNCANGHVPNHGPSHDHGHVVRDRDGFG